tara:strand:+ start:7771 stop:10239 length:2469 start_codon:yes stop_codon:yes gene_type:complete
MAVSKTIEALNRISKRENLESKQETAAILALNKIDAQKDRDLMQTKITFYDRERRADEEKLNTLKETLRVANYSLENIYDTKAGISVNEQISTTDGAVKAAEDIETVLGLLQKQASDYDTNIQSYTSAIEDANTRLTHLEGYRKFLTEGAGVRDFDKSGAIDKKDMTLENYFKSTGINMSLVDEETLNYMKDFSNRAYIDDASLRKLNTDVKAALTESIKADRELETFSQNDISDFMEDKTTMIKQTGAKGYTASGLRFNAALAGGDSNIDEYEKRYMAHQYQLSKDMGLKDLIGSYESEAKRVKEFYGVDMPHHTEFLYQLEESLANDYDYNIDTMVDDLGRNIANLENKKPSKENAMKVIGFKIQKDLLLKSQRANQKYIRAINMASGENPIYDPLIDEIEARFEEWDNAVDINEQEELTRILKEFYGFDPLSRADRDFIDKQRKLSDADRLTNLGLPAPDEIDMEGAPSIVDTSYGESEWDVITTPEITQENALNQDETTIQGADGDWKGSLNDLASKSTNYLREAFKELKEISRTETKGDESTVISRNIVPTLRINPITAETTTGELEQKTIENTLFDLPDSNYEEIYEQLSPFIKRPEIEEWQHIAPENLQAIPTGRISFTETEDGMSSPSQINWVTGDVYIEGQYVGSIEKDEERDIIAFPTYDDGTEVMRAFDDRNPYKDKDYVRRLISNPRLTSLTDKILEDPSYNVSNYINDLIRLVNNDRMFKIENFSIVELIRQGQLPNADDSQKELAVTFLQSMQEVIEEFRTLSGPLNIKDANEKVLEMYDKDTAWTAVEAGKLSEDVFWRVFPMQTIE